MDEIIKDLSYRPEINDYVGHFEGHVYEGILNEKDTNTIYNNNENISFEYIVSKFDRTIVNEIQKNMQEHFKLIDDIINSISENENDFETTKSLLVVTKELTNSVFDIINEKHYSRDEYIEAIRKEDDLLDKFVNSIGLINSDISGIQEDLKNTRKQISEYIWSYEIASIMPSISTKFEELYYTMLDMASIYKSEKIVKYSDIRTAKKGIYNLAKREVIANINKAKRLSSAVFNIFYVLELKNKLADAIGTIDTIIDAMEYLEQAESSNSMEEFFNICLNKAAVNSKNLFKESVIDVYKTYIVLNKLINSAFRNELLYKIL